MAFFVDYKENTGILNMGLDEKILEHCIEEQIKEPVLRFYGWSPPCVSLGRNQKEEGVDFEVCKKEGIDVVKRATGGRALFHQEEITYSFVCPVTFLDVGESVIASYKEISAALILGLAELGVCVDFGGNKKNNNGNNNGNNYCMSLNTGADLCYEQKKLIGSAQMRKKDYLLQHGSLLLDIDKKLIEKIFKENFDDEKIVCFKQINSNYDKTELLFALKGGFEKKFNVLFNKNETFLNNLLF